jgi:hypothetical protein
MIPDETILDVPVVDTSIIDTTDTLPEELPNVYLVDLTSLPATDLAAEPIADATTELLSSFAPAEPTEFPETSDIVPSMDDPISWGPAGPMPWWTDISGDPSMSYDRFCDWWIEMFSPVLPNDQCYIISPSGITTVHDGETRSTLDLAGMGLTADPRVS